MSEQDAASVKARACDRPCVLGLRYAGDTVSPRSRIEAIEDRIGPAFRYDEVPGRKHATLTLPRHPGALE